MQAVEFELYIRRDNAAKYPIVLTRQEKEALVEFLSSLSGAIDR